MKLYKYLTLIILLGMASAAYATPIDPTIILRGDGASQPVGPTFGGAFPTPAGAPFACPTDGPQNNCFQNGSQFTFIALHLFFDNLSLSYSCDNSLDPFFTNCSPSDNEVTFSGLGFADSSNACGEGGCQGIQNLDHFLIGTSTGDMTGYEAVAELPIGSTPEPASVLLFVIAMGAIALFLKRA